MKQKFFRVEWEGDGIESDDIESALKEHYRKYDWKLKLKDVHQISDKVFEGTWVYPQNSTTLKDTDCCSTTIKHNYQPPICVNCGKEKPKNNIEGLALKSDKLDIIVAVNQLIEVVNNWEK